MVESRRQPVALEIRSLDLESPSQSCDFASSSKLWGMLSGIGGIFWNGCENVQPLRIVELPNEGDDPYNGNGAALLELSRKASDDHVAAALMSIIKQHPQVLLEHQIAPAPALHCYYIDGREVRLEVASSDLYLSAKNGLGGQVSSGPDSPILVCQDSVMRQPFLDYVFNTGYNEWYEDLPGISMKLDGHGIFNEIPEPPPVPMDRFDAMKFAHQQALERERKSIHNLGIIATTPVMVSPQQAVDLPNFMPSAGGA